MARDHYFTRDMMPTMDGSPAKKTTSVARFMTQDVKDHAKTTALGRPAYRKIEIVEIINPGDPQNIVRRRVKESDKERFPQAWEAFQRLEEYIPDGTPLEHFPLLSKGQIEHMRMSNIFTIEQLADVPDVALQNLGLGARRMRDHARAYLENAEKGAVPAKLVEDNEHLRNQVKLLTNQLNDITARLEQFAAKAGHDVSDIDNTAAEVVAAIEQKNKELSKNLLGDLPEDWELLSYPELKVKAAKVTDEKIKSKAHAVEIIKEYRNSRIG